MTYKLTRDDLKTLGNGIRNANSMSVEEHLDAFLAYKPTDDWQVIASGEVKVVKSINGETYIDIGEMWAEVLLRRYLGKNIEIAVRVKDSKEKLNKTRKKD